jgi:L-aspartate oxidase
MDTQTDFLIVGSGIAGLMYALKVADHGTVAIVTKKQAVDSNTNLAQGGIASVFDQQDSFDLHIRDTLDAGDGLCNPDVVHQVVVGGPERIRELMTIGVSFNTGEDNPGGEGDAPFDLGREGGHSCNRIVHAHDMTGREVERVLLERARQHRNIRFYENHMAIDLITYSTRIKRGLVTTTHEDYCCGAYVLDHQSRRVKTFGAGITLLATGGAGKVYLYTSNPDIATGDGIAMGYRAGATVANLEFVQFHPTCLYHPAAKNFLISEAVRGEGGRLMDADGNSFMERYDPKKDLACRDVVARAIDTELKRTGQDSVFLDISHLPADRVTGRFPNLYEKCLSFGIDMTQGPIPVVPAAHYMCGGVATDMFGRTDINRLYAVGETACTGLHGANRLASNSLLEALVYADAAARQALQDLSGNAGGLSPTSRTGTMWAPATATSRSWSPTTGMKSDASCGIMWASSARINAWPGPSDASIPSRMKFGSTTGISKSLRTSSNCATSPPWPSRSLNAPPTARRAEACTTISATRKKTTTAGKRTR